MKSIFYYFVILLLVFCSLSCKKENVVIPPEEYKPPTDIRKIIPLSIGHSWTYYANNADTIVHTIVDTTRCESNTCFFYYVYNGNSDVVSEALEWTDSVSYTRNLCYENCGSETNIVLKAPIVVGNRWQSYYNRDSIPGFSRIISVDSPLVVQGNKYLHTIVVEESLSVGKQTHYIVPGIGIVEDNVRNLDGNLWELVRINF